jgi:hypothetical protein
MQNEISVAIVANSKDFFLTKLCVASIRYYHPNAEILLIKDKLNGSFSSKILEKRLNVKVLKLKKKYFGWGSAKIHFHIDLVESKKRYLLLDSDIIFIGKLLDKFNKLDADFILHSEIYTQPFSETVKRIFINPEVVKTIYPEYEYPGYFFNTGQFVTSPSHFNEKLLDKCFNKNRYPYFTNRKVFHMPNQSIFNTVLPIMFKKNNSKVETFEYMLWSKKFLLEPENAKMSSYLDGKKEYLIHYAGDIRSVDLSKMKGSELLIFFKTHYENKLTKLEKFLSNFQDKINSNKKVIRFCYIKNTLLLRFFKIN